MKKAIERSRIRLWQKTSFSYFRGSGIINKSNNGNHHTGYVYLYLFRLNSLLRFSQACQYNIQRANSITEVFPIKLEAMYFS